MPTASDVPSPGVRSITAVLADDHPAFREGLRAMLQTLPGVSVVGEAGTGVEAVTLEAALQPDLVVMDLHMPEMDGIEATRRISATRRQPAVLIVTMYEDDDSVFAAMRAGARGYLLKTAQREEVLRAVSAVTQGEVIFAPGIADRVLAYFANQGRRVEPAFPELTDREREVLDLITQGSSNQAIARSLHLTAKTVRNHTSNILRKLQVADRAELLEKSRAEAARHKRP